MNIKLKKLTIKNFKIFPFVELEITTTNLALLDGPNGFGKTTFYDALELLFLGEVTRYIALDSNVSNQRKHIGCFPLLYDGTKSGDSLSIEAKIELDHGVKYIKRCATKETLESTKRIADAKFDFYVKELESDKWEKMSDDETYLSKLLGNNYKKNYGLFHYIEQEENTAMLKRKGESKQEKIDHLFDVEDYRKKIEKLTKIRTSIAKLKTQAKKTTLVTLLSDLNSLKKESLPDSSNLMHHTRLIETKNFPWDGETVDFSTGTYAQWTSETGILARLKYLKENSENFLYNRYNENIKKRLALQPNVLIPLLQFGHHLDNITQYQIEVDLCEVAKQYVKNSKAGLVKLINNKLIFPKELIREKLPEHIKFDKFQSEVEELITLLNSSDQLSQHLSQLKSSRAQYLEDHDAYQKQLNSNESECPTCGHDWLNHEQLLAQFKIQEQALASILKSSNSSLQIKVQDIETKYLSPIISICIDIVNVEKSKIDYKTKICELDKKQINYLNRLKKTFDEYQIDLSSYYLPSFDLSKDIQTELLIEKVKTLYKPVIYDNLSPDLDDVFTEVFENNENELLKLTIATIDIKIKYLQQQYAKSRLQDIKDQEKAYKQEKNKFDNAVKIHSNLGNLISLYTDNVNDYIESISKGIEILFHIYSGRLLQNFHNGLGIFIESDGKSISFKDTPTAEHDVIFTMSSGQLSSLVIAFTMALNHKYAKHSLLLIDDPVQTMDEINVAGFIDLLRHEFRDRQIFISTHEDHTSSYFRYKFGKADLETQRINFKDIQNSMNII
ncbi:MAG: AAA family ATPase [Alteromonadaceae bacterium]|nr:AAA family ATPase [Alteromonadaceae bacterium]